MIEIKSKTFIRGLPADFLEEFMLTCDDEKYQRWWEGVHFQFHTLSGKPGSPGQRVWMEEYVGMRHVTLSAIVEEFVPGRKIVWRLSSIVPLPVRLQLEYSERGGGTLITHTIRAGSGGLGVLFDSLFRLYFSRAFVLDMAIHMRFEFHRLREVFLPGPA